MFSLRLISPLSLEYLVRSSIPSSPRHFHKFGCRYNKEIDLYIDAIKDEVDVVVHERYDYGTVHMVIAKKKSKGVIEGDSREE